MNKNYEYKDLVFVEDLKEFENRNMERSEQPVGHIISGGVILPFLPESTDSVKGRGGGAGSVIDLCSRISNRN